MVPFTHLYSQVDRDNVHFKNLVLLEFRPTFNPMWLQLAVILKLIWHSTFSLHIESPKSYISEDAGSPCSVDPNTMDVDPVGSPPTMVNLPCKLTWYYFHEVKWANNVFCSICVSDGECYNAVIKQAKELLTVFQWLWFYSVKHSFTMILLGFEALSEITERLAVFWPSTKLPLNWGKCERSNLLR